MVDNVTAPVAGTKFKTHDNGTNGHSPAHILWDTAESELGGLVTANPAANTLLGRLKDIAGNDYKAVAASATDSVLGATGATGDYLKGVLIVPATTGAGNVSIKDGAGSAISIFATGTLSDLKPLYVPIGARSTAGAWKVTTGAHVSVIATGRFT